jgi:DNA-binding CsgD family transcriptional regulator
MDSYLGSRRIQPDLRALLPAQEVADAALLGGAGTQLRAIRVPQVPETKAAKTATRRGPLTLSKRQREILELAAIGVPDKEIASRLGISAATVESHWKKLRERFESSSRTSIVASALNALHKDQLEKLQEELDHLLYEIACRRQAEQELRAAKERVEELMREREQFTSKKWQELAVENQQLSRRLHQVEQALSAVEASKLVVYTRTCSGAYRKLFITENISQFGVDSHEFVHGNASLPAITDSRDLTFTVQAKDGAGYQDGDSVCLVFRVRDEDGKDTWVYDQSFVSQGEYGQAETYSGVLLNLCKLEEAECSDPVAFESFLMQLIDKVRKNSRKKNSA